MIVSGLNSLTVPAEVVAVVDTTVCASASEDVAIRVRTVERIIFWTSFFMSDFWIRRLVGHSSVTSQLTIVAVPYFSKKAHTSVRLLGLPAGNQHRLCL